ncbi:uroporphyrinogen-III synthase [Methylocapsa palsarum]|uniref:Uroporphyrinogen-III synthase n=1 Tax=Methylocapsa palsarum TaxID=1612308 RepID=A0A1I3WBX3_9HYPH|nr:uroporphyrinogen-III synthase [Methylocapsa palsarum]SFK04247.1 uroporphyrinogen-III synthase [Methylocapsa palsarum]
MQVLLTRAQDQALRSAAKLQAKGHSSLISSVLEMVPTGADWPKGVLDGVLATSAQAFDLLSDSPEWPLPEARRLLPLFLVGERTGKAARDRGFMGAALIAPDARMLASDIGSRIEGAGRLIYLAGRDRKPDLEAQLKDLGHDVLTIEVYAAQPAESLTAEAVAGLSSGAIGAVLHYSRRSAEIFLDLAHDAGLDVSDLIHIAMSPDAAEPLWAAGFSNVRACEKPEEQAMLELVDELAAVSGEGPRRK